MVEMVVDDCDEDCDEDCENCEKSGANLLFVDDPEGGVWDDSHFE